MAVVLCGFSRTQALDCTIESPDNLFFGDTLHLTANCDVNGISLYEYAWDLSDGGEQTEWDTTVNLKHVYSNIGSFPVFLRVRVDGYYAFSNTYNKTILVSLPATPTLPANSSTIIYNSLNNTVWNVNPDNNSVSTIDGNALAKLREVEVGEFPRTLALDPLGNVWVTNQGSASISILSGSTGALLHTVSLPYASRPYGIVINPATRTHMYVTLQATGKLLAIDIASRKVTRELNIGPSPRALAVTYDGARILVTRYFSRGTSGEVYEVNAASFSVSHIYNLGFDPGPDNESDSRGVPNLLAGVTISPDGQRAFVAGVKDNIAGGLFREGEKLTFATRVRAIICVLDLVHKKEITPSRLDLDNLNVPNAIIFNRTGTLATVTTLTSNTVKFLDAYYLTELSSIEPFSTADVISDTANMAPDGLVTAPGDTILFIHYLNTRTVVVYNTAAINTTNIIHKIRRIPVVKNEILHPQVLRGKQVFYNSSDLRMGKENYYSCETCHVDGGGSDGMVWDFTQGGEGLRMTPPLFGRGGTRHGRLRWTGGWDENQDQEISIRGTPQGTGLLSDDAYFLGTRIDPLGDSKAGLSPDLDALAAYVRSLQQVRPSPYRNPDGSMTHQALEGKKVFNSTKAACFRCHIPPEFTDSRLDAGSPVHDVGTFTDGSGSARGKTLKGLDTPTLKGIWETPPYLHDGSAATMLDVLTTRNPDDLHGETSHLSTTELNNLAAYLLQLDETDEQGAAPVKGAAFSSTGLGLRLRNTVLEIAWSEISRLERATVKAVVRNLQGRVVTMANLNFNGGISILYLPVQIKPGIYFLSLEHLSASVHKKFIFQGE